MARRTTETDTAPTHGTIRAVARRVGVGETTLRRVIRAGEIPIYRPAGAWPLIAVADVVRWLHAQRAEPTAHARARVAEILEREAKRAG